MRNLQIPNPEAFPSDRDGAHGMELRDYFAGQAIPTVARAVVSRGDLDRDACRLVARVAYEIADAMLEERK